MTAGDGTRPVPPAGDGGPSGAPTGRGRPRLTSRAAVLAVVICAIALSLAYPVREYIAQHREIAQLEAQQRMEQAQVRSLQAEQHRLTDPGYVEQQAQARLHMCMPDENCYIVIGGQRSAGQPPPRKARRSAWYATLWTSVRDADHPPAR